MTKLIVAFRNFANAPKTTYFCAIIYILNEFNCLKILVIPILTYPNESNIKKTKKKTPLPWSASELYRQSGRRRSPNLVPTFADRGVSRGQRNGSPRPLISFLDRSRYFFYSSSSSIDLTRLSGPLSRTTTTQKIL